MSALPAKSATDRLRLLLVTARYLPHVGGTEVHTHETARRIAGRGHDVTVLTTNLDNDLPSIEVDDGVRIMRVPAWPRQRDYYFAPALHGVIRRGHWDLIHCQGTHTLVPPIAMLSAIRCQIPFVASFHSGGSSSVLRTRLREVQHAALRSLLARAERLICVSRFEADLFRRKLKLPAHRFVVIPNGADFQYGIPQSVDQSTDVLIVSVGRLERYKGHHRLIEALPYVREARPDVRLRIAGSGPFESELRHLAARLGISDRVEIRAVPAGDRASMAALLARSSLVALLSDYESHGIAVMEALRLRRPVLVSNCSALHELTEQSLAREVSLQSTPRQVAVAILEQLNSPLIPPEVVLPTWDDCANRLLELYSSVVRGSTCAS